MMPGMTEAIHMRLVIVAPESLTPGSDTDEVTQAEAERSRMLRIALLEAGFNIVAALPADAFLPERLAQIQPDMIVVDAESQGRDILEHVVMATRDERRPIVLFSDDEDTSHVRAAIASGVSAYVVAGLPSEKIKPVIDVVMARFRHEEGLRRELADVRGQLEAWPERAGSLFKAAQGRDGQGLETGRGRPAPAGRGRHARLRHTPGPFPSLYAPRRTSTAPSRPESGRLPSQKPGTPLALPIASEINGDFASVLTAQGWVIKRYRQRCLSKSSAIRSALSAGTFFVC